MANAQSVVLGRHMPDTLAPSYSALATSEAGAVAAEMERRKKAKYFHLDSSHFFVPIAVETLGVMGREAGRFFRGLGRRIAAATLDHCLTSTCCSVWP